MSCTAVHVGQLSDHSELKTGVHQGSLLLPFLFSLKVDWFMETSIKGKRNGTQWTQWSQVDDLDFTWLTWHSCPQPCTDAGQKYLPRFNISQNRSIIYNGKNKTMRMQNASHSNRTVPRRSQLFYSFRKHGWHRVRQTQMWGQEQAKHELPSWFSRKFGAPERL